MKQIDPRLLGPSRCANGSRSPSITSQVSKVIGVVFLAAGWNVASGADLRKAKDLITDGRYQDAYELLLPSKGAAAAGADYYLLLGEAALRTQRPDEAQAYFSRALAAAPDSVAAHLGLGRACVALGDYASARIEFETVLRFDGLPPDLQQQAEIYAKAAEDYAAGGRLLTFGYALLGGGNCRVNTMQAAAPDRCVAG